MTKLITAGAVLVIAIIFGFIFWKQLDVNQQQLSGNAPTTAQTNQNPSSTNSDNAPSESAVPKDDSVSKISSELDQIDTNIDADSSQFDTQLKGF